MHLRRVSDGSRVRLGPELGRGGEGAVFPVIGDPCVAKIYFKAPTPAKVEKLRVMTRAATPALLRVAAWPVDMLEDESRRVRGFLMPRVAAREDVHELYSPKSRRRAFPEAEFRFLVRAAANLARAFAQVHGNGHVIGDVNHGNALIGKDATVVLIDCDSFQIRDRAARVFTCDVGVPLFTPPELQGLGFRGRKRSASHDAFGLAVLVFHLLFQGRHPFAGLFDGGEMPIERAIAESRFAYGYSAPARGMKAPPATLPIGAFGPGIALLFERAFAPAGEVARPAAREWVDALEGLERELIECAGSPLHFHVRGTACCWCGLEARSGVRLFGEAGLAKLGKQAIASLWSAIDAVRKPARDPGYSVPASRLKVPKPPHWPRQPDWKIFVSVFGIFGLLMFLIPFPKLFFVSLFVFVMGFTAVRFWRWLRHKAVRAYKAFSGRELARAEQEWKQLVKRWNRECSTALFNAELERLKLLHRELMTLEGKRGAEMRWLRREYEARARELHLAQFPIDPLHFRLGPAEVAALASFGFETAADVIRRMPELPKVLEKTKAMDVMAWARSLSAQFHFDRNAPPDPRLLAAVEQRLAERQGDLLRTLRAGPELLDQKRHEILSARARMEPTMDAAWRNLRALRGRSNSISES